MDFLEESIGIGKVLQDIIADNEIDGITLYWPGIILYQMELIEKWILLSARIDINANDFSNFPF